MLTGFEPGEGTAKMDVALAINRLNFSNAASKVAGDYSSIIKRLKDFNLTELEDVQLGGVKKVAGYCIFAIKTPVGDFIPLNETFLEDVKFNIVEGI